MYQPSKWATATESCMNVSRSAEDFIMQKDLSSIREITNIKNIGFVKSKRVCQLALLNTLQSQSAAAYMAG